VTKFSLSEISTVNASFAEDVIAYAKAGFDGIGIWEMKLPTDDEVNIKLLRDTGLGVANCVPIVPSILPLRLPGMEGPPKPRDRVDALCASMHRLAAYDPECVLVLTGPAIDSSSRQVVIAGLHEIAAAATDAGVRLGLEPAHPSQHQSVSFLNWISDTLTLLEDADLPQVGLMADTYNLWGERPEALAAIADRVTGLHVADVPREPERTDRVLPGEGGMRSAEHVAALRGTGWDGYLDVEIFSTPHDFWALPVDEAARRAYVAAARL
jgi:sugar phosphate isomerase/epimerase